MRLLFVLIGNAFRLFWTLLWWPFRLLARSRRPEYVRYRLTGDPAYRRSARRNLRFWKRGENTGIASIEALRTQVRLLSADSQLKGVIFEVDGLEASPAKRREFAALFEELRRAGKEVIGYGLSVSNSEYELLCATDRILLPAAGRIDLTGFAAEVTHLGEGLSRLGIKAHFVRRGEFKTAPEMFTRSELSPVQRTQIETMLDERFQMLVQAVARGRKLSEEDAKRRIDEGPYSARRALSVGLIDGLCSEPDLANLLAPKDRMPSSKDERPEARVGNFAAYASTLPWPPVKWKKLRRGRPLGVVMLNGMIVEGRGGNLPAGPVVAGSQTVIEALNEARKDPRIPAVVLYVSSPGGSAPASEMILEAVRRLAEKKPVVAYFDRVAASGGYMAVCGAKEIWAGEGAIAGSIGVFGGKFDASELLSKLGIQRTLITRGENAGLLSPTRGFTDHERASFEAEIDETYQSFLEIVASARKRTRDEIHARGEGRVFSAQRALEEGLVDRVGGFEDACRRALELAGQSTQEPFEMAMFGVRAPRFNLLKLLSLAKNAQVYALADPWVRFSWVGTSKEL